MLIFLAFGLFVAEAFIVSHGALAVSGVVALAFGGLLLFDTDNEAFDISVPIVIFTAALLGSFFVWVASKAVQTRHRTVHTGAEELIGARGEVRSSTRPRVRAGSPVAGTQRPAAGARAEGGRAGRERPHADGNPRQSAR